jgi:3-oxoacyl-[acyl-carrier protein] reductase
MAEEGSVALVTGASGEMGSAIALELGRQGYRVAVHYRSRAEAAEEVASRIREAGGTAAVFGADLRDMEEAQSLVDGAADRLGPLDVVVNNAGGAKDGLLMMMPEEDWDGVIAQNLKSLYTVTRPALRRMISRRRGRVVNVSSLSGVSGLPGQANYAAAKGGVIAFTRALAREVAPFNILVNAVAPGLIASSMVDGIPEPQRTALLEAVPLKRTGKPEDVARAVAFLVSEQNEYITGHVLFVTGGLY